MKLISIRHYLFLWSVLFISTLCEEYEKPEGNTMNKRSPEENLRTLKPGMEEGKNMSDISLKARSKAYELTCECSWGAPKMRDRIVGGSMVEAGDSHPMMAGLTYPATGCIICGASIITDRHILTAAHCVNDGDLLYLTVGTNKRCRGPGEDGMHYNLFKQYLVHPDYDPKKNHFDIALCVTTTDIVFSEKVGPTCLHAEPLHTTEDSLIILGWGKRSEQGEPNPILHKVTVNTVDSMTCWASLPRGWISEERSTQICTYASDKDACSGDSGGPLFWMDYRIGRLVQVALVSMGIGCARKNVPAINTAIYPFIGWIQTMIDRSSKLIDPGYGIGTPRRQICRIVPPWFREGTVQ